MYNNVHLCCANVHDVHGQNHWQPHRTSNIIQPSAADSFGILWSYSRHTNTERSTSHNYHHLSSISRKSIPEDHLTPESPGMCSELHCRSTCFPPVFPNTVSDSNCSRHCPIDRKSESPSCWRLVQVVRSPAGTSPVPIKSAFDRRSKAQVSTKCPAECFIHLYTTCRP